MFSVLRDQNPVWYVVLNVILHLMVFAVIVSAVVFIFRGFLRKYKSYDLSIFQAVNTIRSPRNNRLMKRITFLGKHQFLIPANLTLIFIFLFEHNATYSLYILLLSLSSLILMFILKSLFHRNRPQMPLLFEAKGLSFPSGHAIMSVCFYGFLLHIFLLTGIATYIKIPVSVIFVFLILLISFSRVYLQVHYLSDVLAGLIIGCAWLGVMLDIFK